VSVDRSKRIDDFEQVYRRYAPGACLRARRILDNESDAREVVHDVFLALLERPERYRGDSALSTFLYSAVTRACLNRLRNHKTRLRLLRRRWLERSHAAHAHVQAPLEAGAMLRSALHRMPRRLAEVAVYLYLDGCTHDEVAELVGCSRRQVSNHVAAIARWAGRQELRSCRT